MSEFCKFVYHNSDYRLLIKDEGRTVSTRKEAGNELLWLSKISLYKKKLLKRISGSKRENLCTKFKY
jgi:hypothetical protein